MGGLLTTQQAAQVLGIDKSRVLQLITAGRLPATKYGPLWLIKEVDIAAVRERKPGRPRKSALAFSDGALGVHTFGDPQPIMRAAQTYEDGHALYEDLLDHYQNHLKSDYLGAPQTPHHAVLGTLNSHLHSLPKGQQERWITWLSEFSDQH